MRQLGPCDQGTMQRLTENRWQQVTPTCVPVAVPQFGVIATFSTTHKQPELVNKTATFANRRLGQLERAIPLGSTGRDVNNVISINDTNPPSPIGVYKLNDVHIFGSTSCSKNGYSAKTAGGTTTEYKRAKGITVRLSIRATHMVIIRVSGRVRPVLGTVGLLPTRYGDT